jgi:hypothetical protein
MVFLHNAKLFANKANVKLLQWHVRECKKHAMLCHPTDGIQWRNFDQKHMGIFHGGEEYKIWVKYMAYHFIYL